MARLRKAAVTAAAEEPFLDAAVWDRWLDPTPLSPAEATALLVSAPDDLLRLHPVSTAVNSPQNDTPELTRPLTKF